MRGEPSKCTKRGPAYDGRMAKNDNIAATGQIGWKVRPTKRSTPFPKGSVLLFCRWITINDGFEWQSMDMSDGRRDELSVVDEDKFTCPKEGKKAKAAGCPEHGALKVIPARPRPHLKEYP